MPRVEQAALEQLLRYCQEEKRWLLERLPPSHQRTVRLELQDEWRRQVEARLRRVKLGLSPEPDNPTPGDILSYRFSYLRHWQQYHSLRHPVPLEN